MIGDLKSRALDLLGRFAPTLARRLTRFDQLADRVFMETKILPFFRDSSDVQTVLFVGTEWYTKHYKDYFRHKQYWTLEIDPAKQRFGSGRHIVAPLGDLEDFVPPNHFDAIVCNGVFYKGAMDMRAEAERSFLACWRSLRPGGWFVLGWNDTPELRPYPPGDSEALATFQPAAFPPIGTSQHRTVTEYRHVYDFFQRPE